MAKLINTLNIEGQTSYLQSTYRKEVTGHPYSYYIFEEDCCLGAQGGSLILGGLGRAINVTIMRYEKILDLEHTIILVALPINEKYAFLRIFVEQKKSWMFRRTRWLDFRRTFGWPSDQPLEIIGVTPASDDHVLAITTLLDKAASYSPECRQGRN
jgi:hypothetical protein